MLSTRSLVATAPVQQRPHLEVTVAVAFKEHGTIQESRIVNYHPYPLSFVTTLDQLDVIIQDSAPVEA